MIQLIVDNTVCESKAIVFSDGAVSLKLDGEAIRNAKHTILFSVSPTVNASSVSFIVNMASDIIKSYMTIEDNEPELILSLPYLPFARADREFEEGMLIPLHSFIYRLGMGGDWDQLLTCDIHNIDAIPLLFQKRFIKEKTQTDCFGDTVNKSYLLKNIISSTNTVICSPDKGANKKTTSISIFSGLPIVHLEKKRNVSTGLIEGMEMVSGTSEDVVGRDVLIVDDICDGGATFLKAAQLLKDMGANTVSLYVTHGIFSKGMDIFEGVVDNIFCYHFVSSSIDHMQVVKFNKK